MNLQQLEYIVAVDKHRHFVTAAAACFVTQATLSMMIKRLEEEIGAKIFDRSRQPVVPTDIGERVVAQARVMLQERNRLLDIVQEASAELCGELRVGIIPTLSPFLLPLFLSDFVAKYPGIRLLISELATEHIVRKLENGELDAGILATPLHRASLREQPLFYEDFVVYAPSGEHFGAKQYLLAEDIDIHRLWMLEEGHCLRAQVINLCELQNRQRGQHQLEFSVGSIETLKKIVQINQGITILPELALQDMTTEQQERSIFRFAAPVPSREIGLVTYRSYVKEKLMEVLRSEIVSHIPAHMLITTSREVVEIV